jgi:hypothetical protein
MAPASAVTALCRDGSQYNGSSNRGACSRHGGVQQWLNEPAAQSLQQQVNAAPPSSPAVRSPQQQVNAAPPSSPAAQSPQQQANAAPLSSPAPVPAPQMPNVNVGTGSNANVATAPTNTNGQVWANLKSKVYHCPGDRYYGKTKSGEFLPESQAIAQGFRPDHGKACAHA